jgi:hypothetical protein
MGQVACRQALVAACSYKQGRGPVQCLSFDFVFYV